MQREARHQRLSQFPVVAIMKWHRTNDMKGVNGSIESQGKDICMLSAWCLVDRSLQRTGVCRGQGSAVDRGTPWTGVCWGFLYPTCPLLHRSWSCSLATSQCIKSSLGLYYQLLWRPKQEDHKFKFCLDYRASSRPSWATLWDPVYKQEVIKEMGIHLSGRVLA